MSRRSRRLSRIALIGVIVAALACLVGGLLLAAKGVGGLGLGTLPDADRANQALYLSGALLVLGLAAFVLAEPDRVSRFVAGRQARHGSNAVLMSLAFVGILIVSNYLAYRYPWTKDLTEDQSRTLSAESLQALRTLPQKVSAVAFFAAPTDSADELLSDFRAQSDGKFDYQYINPDLNPATAREAGVTGEGNILLVMGDRKEIANYATETELTRAMIRLISPGTRTIYVLTGHGEAELEGYEQAGYGSAKSTLESKNYTVSELSLLTTNAIPTDALALIIAGPQKPLNLQEVALIRGYVAEGGSLVVMQDPDAFTEFGDATDPLATYLETTWGIAFNEDVILDPTNPDPLVVFAVSKQPHAITQNLTYAAVFPRAQSLSVRDVAGVTTTALLLTAEQAWGEGDYTASAELGAPVLDEGIDNPGPLNMAVAAESTEGDGRVVVFGNSAFATNEAFDAYGNANMFVNAVDWAAEQDDLINITPRTPIARTFVPPQTLGFIAILLASIIILPGLVLGAGIYAWASRRRRG